MARSELRDEIAASGVPHEPAEFSLVLGGPLYQLFLQTSLARYALERHWWRVIAFMLICCFPPLLFSLLASHLVGGVSVPFLFDVEIHTRCLGMLPLLIASEWIVHDRLQNRAKFKEFVASASVSGIQPSTRLSYCSSPSPAPIGSGADTRRWAYRDGAISELAGRCTMATVENRCSARPIFNPWPT